MPQVFQVLKCYKCAAFQIHQTKKSNKFECKMCGEKQSIKRHYGIGTGKDCRLHVQKLNVLRGNIGIKSIPEIISDEEFENSKINTIRENIKVDTVKRSKWSAFIEKETETIKDLMFPEDIAVCVEDPQATKPFKRKAKTKNSDKYSHSINKTFKIDNIDNSESEVMLTVHDSTPYNTPSTHCKKLLACNNLDDLNKEKSSDKVTSQTVNKNSKWAQYVDTEDDKDVHNDTVSSNDSKCISNSENLFSLCDDSDLDQVLNI